MRGLEERLLLYAVTHRACLKGRSLEEQAEAALKGGASCLQLREKALAADEFIALAKRLGALCRAYGALFIINDSLEMALACGADGVHLGQSDMEPSLARAALGAGMVLGVSVSNAEEALRAQAAGADYLGAGALFPTLTKGDAESVPPEKLKAICAAASIPVVAIGGLNLGNLDCLAGTGAMGAALASAIFAADDAEALCRALKAKLLALLAEGGVARGEIAGRARNDGGGRRGAVLRGPLGGRVEVEGVIFDMDGTLLDSMAIWSEAPVRYLIQRGIQPRKDLRETFLAMTLADAARHYQEAYGVKESVEDIEGGINAIVRSFYMGEAQPKAGVPKLLRQLYNRGVAMCVATATEKSLAQAALDRCGLSPFLSFVITCGETGYGKDKPYIFEEALRRLGLEGRRGRVAVAEDAIHALKTAKGAGFPTIGVYDASYEAHQAQVREFSSIYVRDLGVLEAE